MKRTLIKLFTVLFFIMGIGCFVFYKSEPQKEQPVKNVSEDPTTVISSSKSMVIHPNSRDSTFVDSSKKRSDIIIPSTKAGPVFKFESKKLDSVGQPIEEIIPSSKSGPIFKPGDISLDTTSNQ